MDPESKVCFDSQLLFHGLNLNKIVVLSAVLLTTLLLPIHLDESDALKPQFTYDENLHIYLPNPNVPENEPYVEEPTEIPTSNDSISKPIRHRYRFSRLKPRTTYVAPPPTISLELALLPLLIWQSLAIVGGIVGAVNFCAIEKAKNQGLRARSPPVPVGADSILPDFVSRNQNRAGETSTSTTANRAEESLALNVEDLDSARHRRTHHITNSQVDFYIMLIHCVTVVALLATEVQIYVKCTAAVNNSKYPWVIAMAPMLLLTPLGILATVWAFRRSKVLELEPILATFSIQLLFIALKLDEIITWSWFVVAIPSWVIILIVVTCLAAMLCHIAVSYVRTRNQHAHAGLFSELGGAGGPSSGSQYLKPAQYLSSIMLVLIPMMLFLIMLVIRLDNPGQQLPWKIVFAPFNISVLLLLLLNCCTPNSSRWWFGIREDYCKFVFTKFPTLRTFANCALYVSETTAPVQPQQPQQPPPQPAATAAASSSTQTQQPTARLWNGGRKREGNDDSIDKIPVKYDLFSPD